MSWQKKAIPFLCAGLLLIPLVSVVSTNLFIRQSLGLLFLGTLIATIALLVLIAPDKKRMAIGLVGGLVVGFVAATVLDSVARGDVPMVLILAAFLCGPALGYGWATGIRLDSSFLGQFRADRFAPEVIRVRGEGQILVEAGFAWSNPVPNDRARDFSWSRFVGGISLAAFLFAFYVGFRDYSATGWGARTGQQTGWAAALFFWLCVIALMGSIGMLVLARWNRYQRSTVVFRPDQASITPLDREEFTVALNDITSIEETAAMNKGGGQYMMPDPQHPGQVYPAKNVTIILSSGAAVDVGRGLRESNARIVLAQLNRAMTEMRQERRAAAAPHSDDW